MDKLFTPVQEGHDPKNRIVFIVKTNTGFSVTKPRTGFESKEWKDEDDPELIACYERQTSCTHTHASYLPAEKEAEKVNKVDDSNILNKKAK